MMESRVMAGIVLIIVSFSFGALIGGIIGTASEQNGWRSNCDAMGVHLVGKVVYECRPRAEVKP